MKLRSLLLVAAGIGIGYSISQKMRQDDPEVVRGPQRAATGSPALRLVQRQAQRIADQASVRSLEAIRRARGAIRTRLGETRPSTTRPGTRTRTLGDGQLVTKVDRTRLASAVQSAASDVVESTPKPIPSVIQSRTKKHFPDSLYTAATKMLPVVARSGTPVLALSGRCCSSTASTKLHRLLSGRELRRRHVA